jgi:hypothetical protein
VDAEGLWPDACLAKVVPAARHFIEQVVDALPERAPKWLCRKTVAVEQVVVEHVAFEEGAVEQVETWDGHGGAGGGGADARGTGGSGGGVCGELCPTVPPVRPTQLCPIWQVARSHL